MKDKKGVKQAELQAAPAHMHFKQRKSSSVHFMSGLLPNISAE